MRIFILDDEEIFLNGLESSIYEILPALDNDCIKFQNPNEFINHYKSGNKPDLIFLDIEMPDKDGLEVAREIRKTDKETPIVFLTSHTEMAMDGYEVNAFRFLAKPVNKDKLEKTIEDVKGLTKQANILIRQQGEDIVLKIKDILFIEADNNDIRIITRDKTYVTRRKIAEIIDEINKADDTIRKIHRSTAVNLYHVARIKDKDVILDTNQSLPISRSEFKKFKEELYEYIRKTVR